MLRRILSIFFAVLLPISPLLWAHTTLNVIIAVVFGTLGIVLTPLSTLDWRLGQALAISGWTLVVANLFLFDSMLTAGLHITAGFLFVVVGLDVGPRTVQLVRSTLEPPAEPKDLDILAPHETPAMPYAA